jgi:hypothetical protein
MTCSVRTAGAISDNPEMSGEDMAKVSQPETGANPLIRLGLASPLESVRAHFPRVSTSGFLWAFAIFISSLSGDHESDSGSRARADRLKTKAIIFRLT